MSSSARGNTQADQHQDESSEEYSDEESGEDESSEEDNVNNQQFTYDPSVRPSGMSTQASQMGKETID